MPNLELRYSVGETVVREFTVVDRKSVSAGSEHMDETTKESTTSRSGRSGSSEELQYDELGLPAGRNSTTSGDSNHGSSSTTGRRTADTSRQSLTLNGPDSYATGEDMRWVNEYGICLTWDLSRIIFRQEEMSIVGIEMDKEKFRQEVKAQVIQAYYDLMESLLLLDSQTYRTSVPTQVRRERLGYLLDSLTEGALSNAGGREAP
jgi:hypothetical protein